MSALLFKQIKELTEAVAQLKQLEQRVAALERPAPVLAEKRPVGRPRKVVQ